MFKLFILLMLISTSAFATCMREFTICTNESQFLNYYTLEKVSCSPPGGPVHQTSTLRIFNPLVNDCGPVAHEGCIKPILERELNTTRHNYFQADIKFDDKTVSILIDDRRFTQQGDFHVSTPNADYMVLEGYTCSTSLN